jgi:hypothetical protein
VTRLESFALISGRSAEAKRAIKNRLPHLPLVADAIQEVSGLKLVFFTTEQYRPRFQGKVLDHAAERGFFLRDP